MTSIRQQSNQIINNNEQSQIISSSSNSLDEVLNHVEQWSDTIADSDLVLLSSPRQISKMSHVNPSVNEYVEEQYMNYHSDISSIDQSFQKSNDFEQQTSDSDNQMFENEELPNECRLITQEEDSTYLSKNIDQVIEKIHLDDELFEAKKTSITDIQAPIQLDKNSSIEESIDISNEKIVDYIDTSSTTIKSDNQKPEAIIVTTEESSSIIDSPDYEKIESIQIIPSK
jgi:hypothetical protein